MKSKKLIPMLAAVTLLAVIGAGATLAYFTDTSDTTNIITMGHVEIEIDEPGYEGDDNNEVKDILPGETIIKDPTVTVSEGSADAYIRTTLTIGNLTKEQTEELLAGIVINAGWYYNEEDGYYYYNRKLAAGENATLFNQVTVPENWGNETAGLSFQIVVSAEAIQADNFEPQYNEDGSMIICWRNSAGEPVTAENYNGGNVSTSGGN